MGIGAATARLFAAEGAKIALLDVNKDAVTATARQIDETGVPAMALQADVADESEIQRVVDTIAETFGHVDVLVNNAGIMRRHARMEDWPLEDIRRIIDVNLTGLFITSHAVLPLMKRGGGAVVNIASVGALLPVPYSPCYAATKGGVLALTRSMAAALQSDNMRVNAVLPNFVDTPLTADSPMRGTNVMLSSNDIAQAVRYVACNEAENGAFFAVNLTDKRPRLFRIEDPPKEIELDVDLSGKGG